MDLVSPEIRETMLGPGPRSGANPIFAASVCSSVSEFSFLC